MNSEDFENQARFYVLGALEEDELAEFERERAKLGPRADSIIEECQRLNAAFALTLRPTATKPATKERLLTLIQSALGKGNKNGMN